MTRRRGKRGEGRGEVLLLLRSRGSIACVAGYDEDLPLPLSPSLKLYIPYFSLFHHSTLLLNLFPHNLRLLQHPLTSHVLIPTLRMLKRTTHIFKFKHASQYVNKCTPILSCSTYQRRYLSSASAKLYDEHIPTNCLQKTVLALGSTVMGCILNYTYKNIKKRTRERRRRGVNCYSILL